MTPTRLREIATLLENNCREYQDKVFGRPQPCKRCAEAAEELRDLSNSIQLLNAANRYRLKAARPGAETADAEPCR